MSALQRSTSPPNPTNLSVPEDERILEEDCSAGGSDGSALSRASADAPTSAAPASQPSERIDIENEAASSHPQQTSTSHRPARRETLFGIPQPSGTRANFHPSYDDDNYETRFPPDPIYEEATSPNARVYRVYMEEAAKYDAYMTDEAREGLDVLLVFAGLFSAVLTTFVAQTSQSLQPDRATETTLLLREVASLQRAQINGTSIDSIPSTPTDFTPSGIDVWVNGLWFTSLTLSLASALFAVLIKQWIRHYMSFVSGPAKERSLIRHFRFMGLEKWHVPTLIGMLPVLMHISLALFFAGLTLFLIPLRPSIASIVGSLSTLVFVAYVTTVAWPLFCIQCPYRTPLSTIIYDNTLTLRKNMSLGPRARPTDEEMMFGREKYVSLKEQEHRTARSDDALVVLAFEWLISMSSNLSVHRVVTQAFGGLLSESPLIEELVDSNESFRLAWYDMFYESIGQSSCVLPEKVDLLERLFRSALHYPVRTKILVKPALYTGILSFPKPTLQWESAATAFLWYHGGHGFDKTTPPRKACAVVRRVMSDTREKESLGLPAIVWEHLFAAASSCTCIAHPDLWNPDGNLNEMLTDELAYRVQCRFARLPADTDCPHPWPISFSRALRVNENFIWFLLSPFDRHKGKALDSEKVQQLLSLVNALVSRGVVGGVSRRKIFFGTCKELICEVQAGSVTQKDQEAICVAAEALLREGTALQDSLGPNAVVLPSLLLLHCWGSYTTSGTARKDILLTLSEIDMFKALNKFKDIGRWLWSNRHFYIANNTAPIASLVTSVIRKSFTSWMGSGSQPEDSRWQARWLEYLSLPENSTTIVSMFTFQGTTDTPASVVQVREDLLFFFSSQSFDCDTLQKCRTSLESHLEDFVYPDWRDAFRPNMKEAKKVIDELISQQSPKPANPLRCLRRRSKKSSDPEARYPQVEPSPSSTTNTSSS